MTVKYNASHHGKRLPIRMAVVVAVLVISVSILACSRTEQKPIGPLEKVTVAIVQPLYSVLILVAKSNNYFRDEGLDVTVQEHQNGVAALDALFAGRAELAATAETPVMFAVTEGRRLTILAQTFVSDRNMAIVARKDRGVVAPSDLKGKKIAVSPGTVGEYFLHTFLTFNGISPHEVTIVKLDPVELIAAVLTGKVDAASTWNPHVHKMQKELGGRGLTLALTPPHPLMIVMSSRPDFPAQKPGTVKGVLRALIRAENFVRENPREAIKMVAGAIGIEPDQLGELWQSDVFKVSLDQSLLINLENEARWAINNRLTTAAAVPNFLNSLNMDGLSAVKPSVVTVIR